MRYSLIVLILAMWAISSFSSASTYVASDMIPEETLSDIAQQNYELATLVLSLGPTYEKTLLRKSVVDTACGVYEVGQALNKYHKSYVKSGETLILLDTNCTVR